MSGSGVLASPWPHTQLDTAKRQAELFDCPIDDTSLMMTCLRNVCIRLCQSNFRSRKY